MQATIDQIDQVQQSQPRFLLQLLQAACLLVALIFFAAPPAYAADLEPAIQAQPMVNINQASAAELAEALNGVGLKKAEEIVAWREKNGPFKEADELAKVKGIGAATIEKNRSRIQM